MYSPIVTNNALAFKSQSDHKHPICKSRAVQHSKYFNKSKLKSFEQHVIIQHVIVRGRKYYVTNKHEYSNYRGASSRIVTCFYKSSLFVFIKTSLSMVTTLEIRTYHCISAWLHNLTMLAIWSLLIPCNTTQPRRTTTPTKFQNIDKFCCVYDSTRTTTPFHIHCKSRTSVLRSM